MIVTKRKCRKLTSFLIINIICSGLIYIIVKSKIILTSTFEKSSIKPIVSSREFCHPPHDSPFRSDRLRQLSRKIAENKSAYVNESDASKLIYIPQNYSTLIEFIENTRQAFMSRRLIPHSHSIQTMFRNPPYKDMVIPSCDGLWMEFGVFQGGTLSQIAEWKAAFCGNTSQPVYGFDTFSGLPMDWRPGFASGHFAIPNGTMILVPSNTVLVKGLFIDTLPTQLRLIDRKYRCTTPVSFIHIDCDLYDGARDVLFLLGNRLVSGSILVFDELFNYPGYEKHEIKALFEFLSGSNLRLIPLGASGNIELKPTEDLGVQSFALVTDMKESH